MKKLNSRTVVAAISAGALIAGGVVAPANAQSSNGSLNGDSVQNVGSTGGQGSNIQPGDSTVSGSQGGNIELALAIALGASALGGSAYLAAQDWPALPPLPDQIGGFQLPQLPPGPELPDWAPPVLGGAAALGLGLALVIALNGGSSAGSTGSTANGGELPGSLADLGSSNGGSSNGSSELNTDSLGNGSSENGSSNSSENGSSDSSDMSSLADLIPALGSLTEGGSSENGSSDSANGGSSDSANGGSSELNTDSLGNGSSENGSSDSSDMSSLADLIPALGSLTEGGSSENGSSDSANGGSSDSANGGSSELNTDSLGNGSSENGSSNSSDTASLADLLPALGSLTEGGSSENGSSDSANGGSSDSANGGSSELNTDSLGNGSSENGSSDSANGGSSELNTDSLGNGSSDSANGGSSELNTDSLGNGSSNIPSSSDIPPASLAGIGIGVAITIGIGSLAL